MRIDGNNSAVVSLRLVQPAPAPGPATADQLDSSSARSQPVDSYSFDAVYMRHLPIQPMTDAHRRLERIRHELVAAKVDVPIHFEHPGSRPAARAANPYLPNHLRFGPDPAALNESATDAAVESLQQKQA